MLTVQPPLSLTDTTMKKKPTPNPLCEHTPHPKGYMEHYAWAQEMLKTHVQLQCPCCGLYAVWRKKKADNQQDPQ